MVGARTPPAAPGTLERLIAKLELDNEILAEDPDADFRTELDQK
jgi:hypothetical protein